MLLDLADFALQEQTDGRYFLDIPCPTNMENVLVSEKRKFTISAAFSDIALLLLLSRFFFFNETIVPLALLDYFSREFKKLPRQRCIINFGTSLLPYSAKQQSEMTKLKVLWRA